MSNPTEATSNANANIPEAIKQLLSLAGNPVSGTNCVIIVNVNINQAAQVDSPVSTLPLQQNFAHSTTGSSSLCGAYNLRLYHQCELGR